MRRLLPVCASLVVACGPVPSGPVAPAHPVGLPVVPVPADNPLTQAKIELGRKLFMDRRLSPNETMSCAMCHVPEQGFTSNEMGVAIGLEGQSLRRNAPTIYNAAYMERLFHDGREISLENQVWGPLLAANEMGNPSIGYVVEKIGSLPDYGGLFEAAFRGRGPTMETIGQAIAAYERTVISGRSRFDRWRYGGEAGALGDQERLGFALFTGKAGCARCHTVGESTALFTDQRFHNTGVGWARSMVGGNVKHRVQLAPGVFTEIAESATRSFSEARPGDVGRFEVTQDPADRWAYRTPSLRNVALTAPYMHDGSFATLEEVVEFYDRGGIDNPAKDPLLKPLELSQVEKQALAAYLRALTGDNVDALAAAARLASATAQ
jgi:cytochrome c peroxidase